MFIKIDFAGFYSRPDHIGQFLEEFAEEISAEFPQLRELDVQVQRSFFGTYTTKLRASLIGEKLEEAQQTSDPIEGLRRCLNRVTRELSRRKHVSEVLSGLSPEVS